MMDADLKRRWVESLRSGRYQQGQGVLRDADDNYCCLGVLCDLVDPDGWRLHPDSGFYGFRHGTDEDFAELPFSLSEEFGVDGGEEMELIGLNDDGNEFTVIANWIAGRIPEDANLDRNGRTLKVGVDKHAPSCADDDGRFKCECGLGTA